MCTLTDLHRDKLFFKILDDVLLKFIFNIFLYLNLYSVFFWVYHKYNKGRNSIHNNIHAWVYGFRTRDYLHGVLIDQEMPKQKP